MTRSRPWLTAVLQALILMAFVAAGSPWLNAEENTPSLPRRSDDIVLRGRQARPVFNSSVVAGGVYSLGELRAVIARDPVVGAHYRSADLDRMKVVTLTTGKAAYVSYRRGDTVRWTRQRVWLKPGETVLTDGATMIRARCGNCVSEVQQENVAEVDPAHGELDDFVVPPTPDTGVDAFAADAEEQLADLLQVPFAPAALAWLAPGAALLAPDLGDDPVARSPFGGVPPVLLPGGYGDVIEDGGNPDDRPQPPALMPDISGLPTEPPSDTLTTGVVVRTGDGPDDHTGDVTGTGGTISTGPGATATPEPEILWLVACGIAGLASRKLRGR
jgi:hypothetical protein